MSKILNLDKPPAHLYSASRQWYKAVVSAYSLEPHHLHLLRLAAECLDRIEDARKLIAQEGLTTPDKNGNPKMHPAVIIERDNKATFARLVRQLKLEEITAELEEEADFPAWTGPFRRPA